MRHHIKHMLVGGVVLLGVLLAAGVSVERALPLAAALACPLMMIGMMVFMGRHGSHRGERGYDAATPVSGAHPGDARTSTPL